MSTYIKPPIVSVSLRVNDGRRCSAKQLSADLFTGQLAFSITIQLLLYAESVTLQYRIHKKLKCANSEKWKRYGTTLIDKKMLTSLHGSLKIKVY